MVLPNTNIICCYLGDYAQQLRNSSLSEAFACKNHVLMPYGKMLRI